MSAWTSASLDSDVTLEQRGTAEGLLRAGKWAEARAAFEAELQNSSNPDVLRGLGEALWWLGELEESNAYYRRAYAGYLRQGNSLGAAETALALCVTYRSCLGNIPAAAGWLARAERVVSGEELARFQGWFWLMHGYLDDFTDLKRITSLAQMALDHAHTLADKDLELCALSLPRDYYRHGRPDRGRLAVSRRSNGRDQRR